MDVAFGDNLRSPRRLNTGRSIPVIPRVIPTCSERTGIGSHSDYSLLTLEEWLVWIERFADELTGRELREYKEAARAAFIEPTEWQAFRKRYADTGDPWVREEKWEC
jgi:hypothetical protein